MYPASSKEVQDQWIAAVETYRQACARDNSNSSISNGSTTPSATSTNTVGDDDSLVDDELDGACSQAWDRMEEGNNTDSLAKGKGKRT